MRPLASLLLKVAAGLLAAFALIETVRELVEVTDAVGKPNGVPHGGAFGVLLQLGLLLALSVVLLFAAKRVADPQRARHNAQLSSELREIYDREKLAEGEAGTPAARYAGLSQDDLVETYNAIDRAEQEARFAELLLAIKHRVEAGEKV